MANTTHRDLDPTCPPAEPGRDSDRFANRDDALAIARSEASRWSGLLDRLAK
ncbi:MULTISPECIES: hypothetical protein [unclassified Rhodococcus (in: high G+C Gram-positive bacteria)]|uniref:hypothetical protein n=1 Tax=unclassified Rhodococcus (in: high G+C Gram-positive bacteria) TaxID=192944 RepID=UPI003392E3DC